MIKIKILRRKVILSNNAIQVYNNKSYFWELIKISIKVLEHQTWYLLLPLSCITYVKLYGICLKCEKTNSMLQIEIVTDKIIN